MMKNLAKLLFVIIVFSIPAKSFAVQYCACSQQFFTPQQKLDMSYATFTGEVDKIERLRNPDRYKVTFKISNSWKGIKTDKASVFTDVSDNITAFRKQDFTCGYAFKEGESYLIYSDRFKNSKGPSWVSACGDVIPLGRATQDIQYLNSLETIELRKRR